MAKRITNFLIQEYQTNGIEAAIKKEIALKEENNKNFDYGIDSKIAFINYILGTATAETKQQKEKDVLKVLEMCEQESPNSPLVALTYADTYLVFNDTVKVNNYIEIAKKRSNNSKEVLEYASDIKSKMRNFVFK